VAGVVTIWRHGGVLGSYASTAPDSSKPRFVVGDGDDDCTLGGGGGDGGGD
jgi:hypothetical protein